MFHTPLLILFPDDVCLIHHLIYSFAPFRSLIPLSWLFLDTLPFHKPLILTSATLSCLSLERVLCLPESASRMENHLELSYRQCAFPTTACLMSIFLLLCRDTFYVRLRTEFRSILGMTSPRVILYSVERIFVAGISCYEYPFLYLL